MFDVVSVSIFGCVSRTWRATAVQALSCIEHNEPREFETSLRSVLQLLQARRTTRKLLSNSEAANLDQQLFSLFLSDDMFLVSPKLVELLNSGASLSSFPDYELDLNLQKCWKDLLSAVVPPPDISDDDLLRFSTNDHPLHEVMLILSCRCSSSA